MVVTPPSGGGDRGSSPCPAADEQSEEDEGRG